MALLKNELGSNLNGMLWTVVIGLVAGWWFASSGIGMASPRQSAGRRCIQLAAPGASA